MVKFREVTDDVIAKMLLVKDIGMRPCCMYCRNFNSYSSECYDHDFGKIEKPRDSICDTYKED